MGDWRENPTLSAFAPLQLIGHLNNGRTDSNSNTIVYKEEAAEKRGMEEDSKRWENSSSSVLHDCSYHGQVVDMEG